ncbi:uncharacterized protein LOC115087624 isoform X2 [Rhinatrema bivittatum]|uniref:uncharacterized protein LOC115087624 isoform X2 n=1 Tax=Rhinatrema bivittatum TaxID=194408 RepID=UPI00112B7407|nr:uncharacterized protein LOC115087624 isoform X2 [Rhinatrema bivittatum]
MTQIPTAHTCSATLAVPAWRHRALCTVAGGCRAERSQDRAASAPQTQGKRKGAVKKGRPPAMFASLRQSTMLECAVTRMTAEESSLTRTGDASLSVADVSLGPDCRSIPWPPSSAASFTDDFSEAAGISEVPALLSGRVFPASPLLISRSGLVGDLQECQETQRECLLDYPCLTGPSDDTCTPNFKPTNNDYLAWKSRGTDQHN